MVEKKLLYKERNLSLYHFENKDSDLYEVPVLLVPPLMNTSKIFDLAPNLSFAKELSNNGFNVYLVDFGNPDIENMEDKLDLLILDEVYRAVFMTKKHSLSESVSILGFCMGGLSCVAYSSASNKIKDYVKNVINIAGPVDFRPLKFYEKMFKPFRGFWFRLADAYGYLPGGVLSFLFKIGAPLSHIKRPFRNMFKKKDKEFLEKHEALTEFFNDFRNIPAESFKQMMNMIEVNSFVRDTIQLMDVDISLSNFNANLLTISGSKDKFIPSDAVTAMHKYINVEDAKHIEVPLGHLSMIFGSRAKETTWKHCVDWLRDRSGSKKSLDSVAREPVAV